jgi:Prokaryotic E2 family E
MSHEHEDHASPESHPHCDAVEFFVNDHRYETLDHTLTGLQIKHKASIPAADELFLETECGDDPVPNDATVLIRKHDRFHSMPSPQYGALGQTGQDEVAAILAVHTGVIVPEPDGWHHLILHEFSVPAAFNPRHCKVLIKLPPAYPLAAPDMFWLSPGISLVPGGGQPQASSVETIGGEQWQRFSWHLPPGYWQPGKTTLRDFVRAVAARLQKGN